MHDCPIQQGRGHTAEEHLYAVQLATARSIFVVHNALLFIIGLASLVVALLLKLVR